MPRFFGRQTATLLRLDDDDRRLIADLPIVPLPSSNAWIAIEDEIKIAERPDSGIDPTISTEIDDDLAFLSHEGYSIEKLRQLRKRAAWLAGKFIRRRQAEHRLTCDECDFDPKSRTEGTDIVPRSLLDVHHKKPLDEGVRCTMASDSDFALLCPTCHRLEHARINALRKQEKNDDRTGLAERLMEIGRHLSSLPVLDDRTDDEILGYDERGLPN